MINTNVQGSYKDVNNFLQKMLRITDRSLLDRFGKIGVDMLRDSTPVDSGITKDSWRYDIHKTSKGIELSFSNSNVSENGVPIVVYIMHGHVSADGTWVEGNNFVKPVVNKLMKYISDELNNVR